MKAKIVKRTLSLITVLALIFTLAAQGVSAIGSIDVNKYPYVYVHAGAQTRESTTRSPTGARHHARSWTS